MTARSLFNWKQPIVAPSPLLILNSITNTKQPFVPKKVLSWYNCGPTVYDDAHLGHARLYITIDYLNRILNYLGHQTMLVMNITDIDDKIINRTKTMHYKELVLNLDNPGFATLVKAVTGDQGNSSTTERNEFVAKYEKQIMEYYSTKELDNQVFIAYANKYEQSFTQDMVSLNVKCGDIITRVSDYITEIINFILKIIHNGFAYQVNGSVYFDTNAFKNDKKYYYAKLVPSAVNNTKLMEEGEGILTNLGASDKRNNADFALWKRSKPGEPKWESPWGQGRPGWHIECSAMAGHIFGNKLDIHSGGIDLAFPHHDNEMAQSEACFQCDQWVDYFIHVGHLHINGLKMSKSLKNFITIKQALQQYTSNQLRYCFLMHQWSSPMDYKDETMCEAISYDRTVKNFHNNCVALINSSPNNTTHGHNHNLKEQELVACINETKNKVHEAFLDSFSTPIVLKEILGLITNTNKYLNSANNYNIHILKYSSDYVINTLKMLGITFEINDKITTNNNNEAEYLNLLAQFRDEIRSIAIENNHKDYLKVCDLLRDVKLRDLGVILDDKDSNKSLVKIVGKHYIEQENTLKETMKKEKEKKNKELADLNKLKQQNKTQKAKIDPTTMFVNPQLYSKYDEKGVPTHLANNEKVSKSQYKKMMKEWEKQNTAFQEYLDKNKD